MKKWILAVVLLGAIIAGIYTGIKYESIGQPNNVVEPNEPNELDILGRSLEAEFESQFVYLLNQNKELFNKVNVLQQVLNHNTMEAVNERSDLYDKVGSLTTIVNYLNNPKRHKAEKRNIAGSILNANVYVAAYGSTGLMWQGSGTLISSDGLILTAAHVIGKGSWLMPVYFEIELFDGTRFKTDKAIYRNDVDLGFIQIDVNSVPLCGDKLNCVSYIDIFDTQIDYIDEVYICGNPYGYECRFNITKGIVSGKNRDFGGFFGDYYLIQADAQSQPGNSGGGVFNMQGEIVGVLVGGYQGVDGMSLIVPSNIIVEVLDIYELEMELESMKVKNGF